MRIKGRTLLRKSCQSIVWASKEEFSDFVSNEIVLEKKYEDGVHGMFAGKSDSIYSYISNGNIGFIAHLEGGYFNLSDNKKYIYVVAKAAIRFDNSLENSALKCYKAMAESVKATHIYGESKFSEDVDGMWKNWVTNPKKYGFESGFILNKDKNIAIDDNFEDYWKSDELYVKYIPVVTIKY